MAHLVGGSRQIVTPHDPDDVIRPVYLEARSVAREYIEYELPGARLAQVQKLCLDLAGLDAEAPRVDPMVVCIGPQTEPGGSGVSPTNDGSRARLARERHPVHVAEEL